MTYIITSQSFVVGMGETVREARDSMWATARKYKIYKLARKPGPKVLAKLDKGDWEYVSFDLKMPRPLLSWDDRVRGLAVLK